MSTRSLTTKAGVFVTEGADLRFEALSAPTDAELDVLLRKIARRLIRLLRPPADVPEPDALDFLESAQHAALSAWQPARNDAPAQAQAPLHLCRRMFSARRRPPARQRDRRTDKPRSANSTLPSCTHQA
jgi:hypothetical protein